MNKKIIILVICLIIAVCTAVGMAQHIKNSQSKETETISISDITQASAQTETNTAETEASSVSEQISEATSSIKKEQTVSTKAPDEKSTKATQPATTVSKTTTKKAVAENTETEKQKITVTFSVNSSKAREYGADAPEYIISPMSYIVSDGTTAFDILDDLCRIKGIPLEYKSKNYIISIGGLKEKDCGAASGWMYSVNGERPPKPASKYVLQSGDRIEWYYVTSAKD